MAERVARRDVSLGLAGEVHLPAGVLAEPFLDDEVIGIAAPSTSSGFGAVERSFATSQPKRCWCGRLDQARGPSPNAIWRGSATSPPSSGKVDKSEAIKRSVAAGLGVAFVSRLVVEDELRRGELVLFQLEGVERMARKVELLRPEGRELTPSERAFVVTLCSCCDAQVAGCTAGSLTG